MRQTNANLSQPPVDLHEFELDDLYKIALKLKEFATNKKRTGYGHFQDKTFIEVTLDYAQKLKKFIGRASKTFMGPVELDPPKHIARSDEAMADNANLRSHSIPFSNASVITTDWTPTADFYLQKGGETKNMDDNCELKSDLDPNIGIEAGDRSLYLDILEAQLRDARLAALVNPPENPFCGNKDPREFLRWINKLEAKMNQLGGDPWDQVDILERHTVGDARKLVQILSANYNLDGNTVLNNIKSELRFRYGGDLVVAQAVLNDIAKVPQMSNNDNPETLAKNIRFLSDLCCEAALLENSELLMFDTTLGLQIIRNKLPRFIDTKWRRFILEYMQENPGTVHPTFKVFVQFLKNEEKLLNFEGFPNKAQDDRIKSQDNRIQALENQQNTSSQYSRLNSITITPKRNENGSFMRNTVPAYSNSEDTKQIVRQLFKDHLHLELADSDISITHRLQPVMQRNTTGDRTHDRHKIVVRFCREDLVGTVFRHCKETIPPFYINELLTPVRSSICYALRTLKRKHPQIARVRTFKGVPRVFLHQEEQPDATAARRGTTQGTTSASGREQMERVEISTLMELEDFTRDRLNTTLQEEGISLKIRV